MCWCAVKKLLTHSPLSSLLNRARSTFTCYRSRLTQRWSVAALPLTTVRILWRYASPPYPENSNRCFLPASFLSHLNHADSVTLYIIDRYWPKLCFVGTATVYWAAGRTTPESYKPTSHVLIGIAYVAVCKHNSSRTCSHTWHTISFTYYSEWVVS